MARKTRRNRKNRKSRRSRRSKRMERSLCQRSHRRRPKAQPGMQTITTATVEISYEE